VTNDRSGDEEAGDQDAIRERVISLAFGDDPDRYDEFVRAIDEATPAGVDVILRGSAVTGHKWHSEEPFDADGPGTSDLDVTFVGGGMVALFRDFHIPGVHSAPLSEAHPFASPALGPLRNGDPYRPDQIEALESAVHKVGFDFYALRIERLESELMDERANVRTLRAQLSTATMMALRAIE